MKTYMGGCHCGAVRYEVTADKQNVISCNCSHCGMKGLLLTFVPESAFSLLSGSDTLTEYQFNKKQIRHLFCQICGVQSYALGSSPEGEATVAINVRCLDAVDMDALSVVPYDGKSA